MASSSSAGDRPALPRQFSPLAGLLSYLVPGLGQIMQGRVAKGLLFFVCIYGLFFYGMYLGSGSVTIGERKYTLSGNVYLPDKDPDEGQRRPAGSDRLGFLKLIGSNLYARPQFAGQFWVGVAAWPAILQYKRHDRDQAERLDRLLTSAEDVAKSDPDLAKERREEAAKLERELAHPMFGSFMREPSPSAVNAVQNASDKRLEVGWVFTVIAGVLNLLVIYDAVAGPAHLLGAARKENEKKAA